MNIVENLVKIRDKYHVPQKVLADAINVDESVISKIENGKRKIKVDELAKMADAMGIPLIDIITYPKVYVEKKSGDDPVEAILQIKLSKQKKEEVLKLVLGDNIEILD